VILAGAAFVKTEKTDFSPKKARSRLPSICR
jgi:hypothetical protein